MQVGIDRISNISTSLRTFSRSDTTTKVAFDIHLGIDSTLMILKHRLKTNDKRPEIEIIKNYGDVPLVECYPGQLNQVFMNIISNAIDALDGYIDQKVNTKFYIQIYTETNLSKQCAIISIKDNGVGMPTEVKEHIFDQFFTTKSVEKGTGLGLSISRQIVEEKHKGKISCISILGEGTEFVIEIPIK